MTLLEGLSKRDSMVLVIVEHFLTDEGMDFFPKWIEQTRNILEKSEGFISLNQVESVPHENRTLLLLKFQSLSKLKVWSSSQEHKQILEKLIPYRLVKQKSQIYQLTGEN